MGNLLVVDDDRAICDVMAEALREEGFTVDCVSTDREAYERINREPELAVLILDVNLGRGTTGYDVARFARQVSPGVAVLYVSGQSSEASFRTNGVPGSAFLLKPFTPAELTERVLALMDNRQP